MNCASDPQGYITFCFSQKTNEVSIHLLPKTLSVKDVRKKYGFFDATFYHQLYTELQKQLPIAYPVSHFSDISCNPKTDQISFTFENKTKTFALKPKSCLKLSPILQDMVILK